MKNVGWIGFVSVVGLSVVGCGGGGGNGDAGGNDVTGQDASDVTTVDTGADAGDAGADAVMDGGDGGAGCALTRALIGTSDFMMYGGFAGGGVADRMIQDVTTFDANGIGVDQDHGVRTSGCIVFDLQRNSGAVRVIDPTSPAAAVRTIDLTSLAGDAGAAALDPIDIAVVSPTKAYVTLYNNARLAIIDPTAGTVTGSVDLSVLADSDGIPDMTAIAVVGNRAFVALQQLTSFTPPDHSHVAVIDTQTDALVDVDPGTAGVQAIELSFGNPDVFSIPGALAMSPDGTQLTVASSGAFGSNNGGVDIIDVATTSVVHSLSAAQLGGNPTAAEYAIGTFLWVAVDTSNDGGMGHEIVQVDSTTGAINNPSIASSDFTISLLRRAPDGAIWALGGDYNNGSVQIFSTTGQPAIVSPFQPGNSLNTTSLDFTP